MAVEYVTCWESFHHPFKEAEAPLWELMVAAEQATRSEVDNAGALLLDERHGSMALFKAIGQPVLPAMTTSQLSPLSRAISSRSRSTFVSGLIAALDRRLSETRADDWIDQVRWLNQWERTQLPYEN